MLTKREAAIVTAYTGFMLGKFEDFHGLAEELLGRPVWTHEFANEKVMTDIKEKAKELFISLPIEENKE